MLDHSDARRSLGLPIRLGLALTIATPDKETLPVSFGGHPALDRPFEPASVRSL